MFLTDWNLAGFVGIKGRFYLFEIFFGFRDIQLSYYAK